MNLSEYLSKYIKDAREVSKFSYQNQMFLTFKELQPIKYELLELDEFKNVDDIVFHELPSVVFGDKTKNAQTYILSKNAEFEGIVNLYSISTGTKVYDTNLYARPVKDDISSLPIIYDEKTFIPRAGVSVFWNPEQTKDNKILGKTDAEIENELVEKFRHAIRNYKDYIIPAKVNVMIRVFDNCIKKSDIINNERETVEI